MTRRPRTTTPQRAGMGLTLLMVMLAFSILAMLLTTSWGSAASVAHERKLSSLGTDARIACENALNEAYYHLMSRANSPELSRKGPVDVFALLRDLAPGSAFTYEVPPALTRRLFQRRRASISKVEVEVLGTSTETTQVVTSVTRTPLWPAPGQVAPGASVTTPVTPETAEATAQAQAGAFTSWTGRPGAAAPTRACDLLNFDFAPQVTTLGVVRFHVSASIDGPRSRVRRSVEVRKGLRILEVAPGSELRLVRLTPTNIATFVDREVEAK